MLGPEGATVTTVVIDDVPEPTTIRGGVVASFSILRHNKQLQRKAL